MKKWNVRRSAASGETPHYRDPLAFDEPSTHSPLPEDCVRPSELNSGNGLLEAVRQQVSGSFVESRTYSGRYLSVSRTGGP